MLCNEAELRVCKFKVQELLKYSMVICSGESVRGAAIRSFAREAELREREFTEQELANTA